MLKHLSCRVVSLRRIRPEDCAWTVGDGYLQIVLAKAGSLECSLQQYSNSFEGRDSGCRPSISVLASVPLQGRRRTFGARPMAIHAPLCSMLFNAAEEGRQFRCSLHAHDVSNLHMAKVSFLCSQYSAILLYYVGASEKTIKFPASLSYVTSRGVPRHLCLGFWLAGWFCFLRVLNARRETGLGIFTLLMLFTAGVTAWFNRPHQPVWHDRIHMAAASLYVLCHIVLMDVLAMSSLYRAGFYASTITAAASLQWSRRIKTSRGASEAFLKRGRVS